MKKLFYILVSAIVALGAVACNNEIDESIEQNTTTDAVSFTVNLDDDATRILIGDAEEGKHPIVFEKDDVIYAENSTLGTYTFVCDAEGKTFYCYTKSNKDAMPGEMVGQELKFYNSKVVDSAAGADGIILMNTGATFEAVEGNTITLQLDSPVLKFVAKENVTIELSDSYFLVDGSYVDTMEFEASEVVQYVAMETPFSALTFQYYVGEDTNPVKSFTTTFDKNKVYDLGVLTSAAAVVNGVNYTELSKALEKVPAGGTITIANDIEIDAQLVVDKDVTIDLNGKEVEIDENVELFKVNEGGKLTIKGEDGTLKSWSALIWNDGGEVVLESGNFEQTGSAVAENSTYRYAVKTTKGTTTVKGGNFKSHNGLFDVGDNAVVVVEGGTFNNDMTGYVATRHLAYIYKEGNLTIKGGDFTSVANSGAGGEFFCINTSTGKLTITDGKFTSHWTSGSANGFISHYTSGSEVVVTGGTYSNNKIGSALATEYKLVESESVEGYYEVKAKTQAAKLVKADESYVIYETLEAALDAAVSGQTVVALTWDGGSYSAPVLIPSAKVKEGVTLDMNNLDTTWGTNSLNINGGTLKNAQFDMWGAATITGTVNGNFVDCDFTGYHGTLKGCHVAAGTSTFTNCTFDNRADYTVHFDTGEGNLVFDGCTFQDGYTAFAAGIPSVTIKNSTFDYEDNNNKFNVLNLYGNATLENVNFLFDDPSVGVEQRVSFITEGKTYVAKNVTINSITAATYEDLDIALGVKVNIDGVDYTQVADGVVLQGEANYLISNKAGLFWVAEQVNGGTLSFKGKTVTLMKDIDLADEAWTPIGTAGYTNYFAGTFDGNEKVISNLTVTHEVAAGLFGGTHGATIKKVVLDGATITSNHYAAGILAWSESGADKNVVENCVVKNSTITSAVKDNDNGDKVGGIVGYAYSTEVKGCSVENVTIQGYRDLGGVVGYATRGEVSNNTLDNVNIVVDNSINYKNYVIQDHYNVNNYVGRIGEEPTLSGNSGEATINWGEIPEYIAKIGTKNYESIAAAAAAVKDGETIVLAEGTHNFGDLAINADADYVIFRGDSQENTIVNMNKSLYVSGKYLQFQNLTYTAPVGLTYNEFAFAFIHHAEQLNFTKCNIERMRIHLSATGEAMFRDCAFKSNTTSGFDGYPLYYYGRTGSKVSVVGSTFDTTGKGIVMYNEGAQVFDLTVENTTFTSSDSTTDKAAIQMHTELGISGKLTINNSTATGFAAVNGGLWNELNNNTKAETFKFTKIVDGKTYVTQGVWVVEDTYEISTKAGLLWFNNQVNVEGNTFKGETVKLVADIDLAGEAWTPVGQNGATQFKGNFDGNNHTISNLNITTTANTAGLATGFFGWLHDGGNVQISNLKINTATVSGFHYVGTIVGYLSGGADVVGCSVENATVVADPTKKDSNYEYNGDKAGVLVGFTNDGSEIKNCAAKNSTITAYRHIGGIVGYTAGGKVEANTVEGVTITVDARNNYKEYATRADYGVGSHVGVAANGATVDANTGEATINWGTIAE